MIPYIVENLNNDKLQEIFNEFEFGNNPEAIKTGIPIELQCTSTKVVAQKE